MLLLSFLLCQEKKTQHRWHRKYFTLSLPGELLLHLFLFLPAFLLTKEFVRHVWFACNKSLNSCGCKEMLKVCKYQVWFPSHIKENKLSSIWKISFSLCSKKEHHVTMIHCYMLISSECMERTQAKPYYLRTIALKRRGAGYAIMACIRCPRTYKGRFSPRTDCMPSITLSVGPSMSPSYFIISAITKFLEPTNSVFFLLFVIQHELSLFGLWSKRQMMGKTFLKLFHLSMTNAEIYMKHQQNGNIDSDPSVQMKSAT